MAPRFTISSVAGGGSTAHLVSTTAANWVILQSGSEVTLIDGGYPGQAEDVVASLRQVGAAPEQIVAALLTHAHVDHLGGVVKLAARYDFPVYADAAEVGHARREYLQQASPLGIAAISYRPRVLRWLAQVLPLGVLSHDGIDSTQPFPDPLDLPGRPRPVAAPGHTDGHSGFLVADGAVFVSGDALVGDHPISGVRGCQCIPDVFQHDVARARETVEAFTRLDAETLFPGHGPRVDGGVAQAARTALAR